MELTEEQKKELGLYGKLWENHGLERIYLDPEMCGLDIKRNKYGYVYEASVDGEDINNVKANTVLRTKVFVDLKSGEIHNAYRFDSVSTKLLAEVRKIVGEEMPAADAS